MDQITLKIITDCIQYVEDRCIAEPGLYRVPGSNSQAQIIYSQYLKGKTPDLHSVIKDPLTATTLLKHALRSTPEPLLPYSLYDCFTALLAAQEGSHVLPLKGFRSLICRMLPENNFIALQLMLSHLKKVSEQPGNKMTVINLAIVFGPTLLRSPHQDSPLEEMRSNAGIVRLLLENSEIIYRDLERQHTSLPILIIR
eukprot:gnl/Dysnectes_brevis/6064_a9125_566.p1 GENE.gnl/Dysnectes_brevis/6064_a9125_566~~gnl/Dysnectes_brevis/6064_a9125_566.p1  ORF type:complete len:198 (+),score=14.02 gnl/Dysnectes_brevis/6064_a9125_566:91-684(+)